MQRTQIYLTDEEYRELKRLSAEDKKVSISGLIRRVLDKEYLSGERLSFKEVLEKVSGIWADREINTSVYIRRLRRNTHRKGIKE